MNHANSEARGRLAKWLPIVAALLFAWSTPSARGQEIQVRSSESRKKSPFLQPPATSSDPYSSAKDWSEIPAWRQTSFFGIRAEGKVFIYVVDCSGSMDAEGRLFRAKREIRRSIQALRFPQKFLVIFYNDEAITMPGGLPRGSDSSSKERMLAWLGRIEPEGGTDPRDALKQALALKPDAVFLLSDGEFPEDTTADVAKQNPRKVPIHCVDLAAESSLQLRKIAKDSGGQYVSRPPR